MLSAMSIGDASYVRLAMTGHELASIATRLDVQTCIRPHPDDSGSVIVLLPLNARRAIAILRIANAVARLGPLCAVLNCNRETETQSMERISNSTLALGEILTGYAQIAVSRAPDILVGAAFLSPTQADVRDLASLAGISVRASLANSPSVAGLLRRPFSPERGACICSG
jgi:hypothetical protein